MEARKLIIYRPKAKEKYYDESNILIYNDNEMLGKLGQNDTLEIEVNANKVQLYVKAPWIGSKLIDVKTDRNVKVEVYKNPKFAKSHAILIAPIPLLFVLFINTDTLWLRLSALIVLILIMAKIAHHYYFARNKVIQENIFEIH